MCGTETKTLMITRRRHQGQLVQTPLTRPLLSVTQKTQSGGTAHLTDLPDSRFLKDKLTQMACQREAKGFCVPGKNNGTPYIGPRS